MIEHPAVPGPCPGSHAWRSRWGHRLGGSTSRPVQLRPARAALSATTPTASTARSSGSGVRAGRPVRSRMRSEHRREPSRPSSAACASTATGSRIAARPREPSTKGHGGGVASGSRPLLRCPIPLPPTASSPPTTPADRTYQSAKQPPAWAPTSRFTARPPGSPSAARGSDRGRSDLSAPNRERKGWRPEDLSRPEAGGEPQRVLRASHRGHRLGPECREVQARGRE